MHALTSTITAAAIATATLTANAEPRLTPPAAPISDLERQYPFTYPLADGDSLTYDPNVPTPNEFLPHILGEHFTRHHDVIDYLTAVAEASPRVTLTRYGTSHQRRPLIALTISSETNKRDLDRILEDNLALTDPTRTSRQQALGIAAENPAVVWLSYNVHGNEGSCTEAAMQVAYTLAAATNPEVTRWLNDTVVVIDPCLNPDGRERYINFFDNQLGTQPDPLPNSAEHREPWPSGRSNHYLFDLNRDWAWLSQPESDSRIDLYTQYMPQLHIDYHEQGYNSPHFFGPGDTPYHVNIPTPSNDWLSTYGEHNATIFDTLGLPFATAERFDYLYPGYGKVMPVYHGAVGMLTEQAGHGRGGLAINVDPNSGPDPQGGYTLTLRERIRNHYLTSLSYVETTANNRERQLIRFYDFFATATEPREDLTLDDRNQTDDTLEPLAVPAPQAFAIMPDNTPGMLTHLHELLTSHGVEIRVATRSTDTTHALPYFPPFNPGETRTIPEHAWIISATQPRGYLARTFLDRTTPVEDIATYDITAWSVPLMLGLDAFELFQPATDIPTRPLDPTQDLPTLDRRAFSAPVNTANANNRSPVAPRPDGVAWAIPADTKHTAHAIHLAAKHNIFARFTGDTIRNDDITLPKGSILIHSARNPIDRLNRFLADLASAEIPAYALNRGIPTAGPALGNNANPRLVHPRVMLLFGSPLSSLSTGHTWNMLDHQFPVEHHRIKTQHFPPSNMDQFNVVIIPSSSRPLSSSDAEALEQWTRQGGTVVAIGRAAHWASRTLLDLEHDAEDDNRPSDDYAAAQSESDTAEEEAPLNTMTYEQRERRSHINRIPGAVLRAELDHTHPLTVGIQPSLAFHVFNDEPLPVADNGFVVARFATSTGNAINDPAPGESEPGDPLVMGRITLDRIDELYNAAAIGNAPSDDQTAGDDLVLSGWISPKNAQTLAGTPAVTHHRLGGGNVICFASDPTNRAMNKAAMRFLMNAITRGPSLAPSLQPLGLNGITDHNTDEH